MSGLRRLSAPDLRLLREIILTVIDEGNVNEPWLFYESDDHYHTQADAAKERSAFCDTIQERIFGGLGTGKAPVAKELPERKGSTDA